MFDALSRQLNDVVRSISGKNRISEKNVQDAVEQIKVALLDADVNLKVVRRFVSRTLRDATGEEVLRSVSPGQQFVKIVHERLVGFLGDERSDLQLKGPDVVSVLMLAGLQGSGKTTTAAKLALRLKKEGRRPLLVAGDLVRPAAIEQLEQLGERIGVPVEAKRDGTPVVDLVRGAIKRASREQFNVVIIDTAGRQQVDEALMEEIAEVAAAARPDERILVADAMTGQNAVDVAKVFHERLDLTGVILSKFDSDTRGGAALSIKTIADTPIKFVGVGEKIEDLEPFYPDRLASRILGMGDVVTLVEKAQETIDQEDAVRLQKKMQSATFTLEDYLDQFQRVRKMGSMQSLLDMIPGMKGAIDPEQLDTDQMKYEEAIIQSMTPDERRNHRIIGSSRRTRIAHGSGTSVFQVNQLLRKFEKTRTMMKKMTKNKKYQNKIMSQMGRT